MACTWTTALCMESSSYCNIRPCFTVAGARRFSSSLVDIWCPQLVAWWYNSATTAVVSVCVFYNSAELLFRWCKLVLMKVLNLTPPCVLNTFSKENGDEPDVCCHRLASKGHSIDPQWPRLTAHLQRSAGGRLLSFRIWSTHLLWGRPGWPSRWLLDGQPR